MRLSLQNTLLILKVNIFQGLFARFIRVTNWNFSIYCYIVIAHWLSFADGFKWLQPSVNSHIMVSVILQVREKHLLFRRRIISYL